MDAAFSLDMQPLFFWRLRFREMATLTRCNALRSIDSGGRVGSLRFQHAPHFLDHLVSNLLFVLGSAAGSHLSSIDQLAVTPFAVPTITQRPLMAISVTLLPTVPLKVSTRCEGAIIVGRSGNGVRMARVIDEEDGLAIVAGRWWPARGVASVVASTPLELSCVLPGKARTSAEPVRIAKIALTERVAKVLWRRWNRIRLDG